MTQADLEQPDTRSAPRRPAIERLFAIVSSARSYFRDQDPTFWVAFTPLLLVSALLYVRSPISNYIFDEQEALLANPYVNAQSLGFWDAVRRDFWGLPPDRSIGSYRPVPNFIWRVLWNVSTLPFFHHWVNIIGHAVNAAIIGSVAFALVKRRDFAWLTCATFATCAVLTEAVTGVVGIADVLGGIGVLSAVAALRLPLWGMPFAVFAALLFGLFSKESAIVGVPLIAWAALVTAPAFHARPLRISRTLLALTASVAALVFYTEFRRRFFPVTPPAELLQPLAQDAPLVRKALRAFLIWFQQPQLPNDPINNPLVLADTPHRIAGGLRVFFRGLGQLVFPWDLSGDYSFPQEPKPERLVFPESVLGALLIVCLPLFGLVAFVKSLVVERRRRGADASPSKVGLLHAVALGAVWLPVAYFPHSNIPVLLPTVRAERFWYLPAFGSSLLLAAVFVAALRSARAATRRTPIASPLAASASPLAASGASRALPKVPLLDSVRARLPSAVLAFFAVHVIQARAHALDYRDDLAFWSSTRRAAPRSAKAHLNYSVMVGARGDLEERLAANRTATELAPNWAMAWVYYGDTLCRLQRAKEAWPHYKRGFELAPNDPNLVALSLQCLWDQGQIEPRKAELLALADGHPGTWLAFLANDIAHHGKEHGGVQKKYRPRSYNEGPRQE